MSSGLGISVKGLLRKSLLSIVKTALKETFAKANLPADIEVCEGAAIGYFSLAVDF